MNAPDRSDVTVGEIEAVVKEMDTSRSEFAIRVCLMQRQLDATTDQVTRITDTLSRINYWTPV